MTTLRSLLFAAASAAALGLFGCYHDTSPALYPSSSVGVVYDSRPPYGIETYPAYPYGGSYAYLVGDRWYVRHGTGWGYYAHEPPALYNYRVERYSPYVLQAPPAYRSPYVAPPAYRSPYVAPPAYAAPPAHAPLPAPYAAPPVNRPAPAPMPAPPAIHAPAPAPMAPPPAMHLPPSAPPPAMHAPPAHR